MRGLDIDVRQSPPPPVGASPLDDTLARATPLFGFNEKVERAKVPVGKLNCAGQGCADRASCRRYTVMVSCGKRVDAEGREHPVFEWASFDLERARLGGRCDAFVRPAELREFKR